MKKGVHPDNYRPVVFHPRNNDTTFITVGTVATEETTTVDGTEYPLVKVHISSSSHPFFTGEERIVDVGKPEFRQISKARQSAAAKAKQAKSSTKPKAKKLFIDETQKIGAKTKTSQGITEFNRLSRLLFSGQVIDY